MMWFCVAAGIGAVLRYLADFYLPRRGILLVNIVGSFLAGAALGLFQIIDVAPAVGHLVLGGFAGSLTTYATVAMVTAQQRMQRTGHPARTWLIQVGLSIIACSIGLLGSVVLFD